MKKIRAITFSILLSIIMVPSAFATEPELKQEEPSYNESIFEIGSDIKLSGNYKNNLFLIGSDVVIEENAHFLGDIYIASSNITINAEVNSLYVAGTKININADINGDLYLAASEINIADGVKIDGRVTYNDDLSNADAILAVTNNTSVYKSRSLNIDFANVFNTNIVGILFTIASFSVVLLLMIFLAPKFIDKIGEEQEKFDLPDFFALPMKGLAVFIIIPIIIALLIITIVGLPAAGILLILLLTVMLIAIPMTGYYIGGWLDKGDTQKSLQKFLRGFIGVAVIEILALIPYVGALVVVFACLFGVGLFAKIIRQK